jgi:hypothetical protein
MVLKALIVTHRYVGVVLGVLMTVWCLSGFVMMYQPWPETTAAERQAAIDPLDLSGCCALPAIGDDTPVGAARIEMLGGEPVLRMTGAEGPESYSLATGDELPPVNETVVRATAAAWATGHGFPAELAAVETIRVDQWSVQGARRWQPLWRLQFSDPAGSWIYVDGRTGEIVQDVNAHERFWNWLGAIPHWLYPTLLRENVRLWNDIVVWSAAIGCFLVITGMVIGFIRLRGASGAWWPYRNRPMWMWHHVLGTFAGALVLTWTFSGLLTMTPWGLLESKPSITRNDIASDMTWADTRAILDRARTDPTLTETVVLRAMPFMGQPYLIAIARDGTQTRLGLNGPAPLTREEIAAGLSARAGLLASARLDLMIAEDDFYYGHKQPVDLPVWRVTLADPDETHIYINATTGDARIVDATAKRYRWWESGLHSLDFAFMRARPVWDIVTLILLAAVTAACATGAWLSFTRIGADFSRLKKLLKREATGPEEKPPQT